MTSINALQFDNYSGIMLCDVLRSWNEEDMQLSASDKIKPCVPQEIIMETGLVAAYGNTGTSTIGDEIKITIYRRLKEEYRKLKEKTEEIPENFKTLEELSSLVFDIILNMKHNHISQQMKSIYGFNSHDYIRGYYENNGRKIEVNDKKILEDCQKFMTWEGRTEDIRPVFLNAGILAGYENKEGFRIFQFSLYRMHREPVEVAFAAGGSGSDMVTSCMTDYLSRKSLIEKRGNIEPLEGSIELIHSLNRACERNLGVGGYYNIILFDGRKDNSQRIREICDHRAKLASEIVFAYKEDFISETLVRELIEMLLFKEASFEEVHEIFLKGCNNRKNLLYRLRGYKKS